MCCTYEPVISFTNMSGPHADDSHMSLPVEPSLIFIDILLCDSRKREGEGDGQRERQRERERGRRTERERERETDRERERETDRERERVRERESFKVIEVVELAHLFMIKS